MVVVNQEFKSLLNLKKNSWEGGPVGGLVGGSGRGVGSWGNGWM